MYIVYGVESLCKSSFTVRNPIGWRTESDWVAYGIRSGGERERWQNERNHSTKQGTVVSISLCVKLRFSMYKVAL